MSDLKVAIVNPGKDPNDNVFITTDTAKTKAVMWTTYNTSDSENKSEAISKMFRDCDFAVSDSKSFIHIWDGSLEKWKEEFGNFPWVNEIDNADTFQSTGVLFRVLGFSEDKTSFIPAIFSDGNLEPPWMEVVWHSVARENN